MHLALPPIDARQRHHHLVELQLLRRQPEGEAEELREVDDRNTELGAMDLVDAFLVRLEVDLAQRARRDDDVRAGELRGAQNVAVQQRTLTGNGTTSAPRALNRLSSCCGSSLSSKRP